MTPKIQLSALLYLAVALAFSSCGTYTHVGAAGDVTVQAGVASSIQQVAVQVKPGRGGAAPTVTVTQTGYDGTSVPNTVTGAWVTGRTLAAGVNTVNSNNHLSAVQARQPTAQAANARVPTITTATGPNGGTLQTVTQPAKAIIP